MFAIILLVSSSSRSTTDVERLREGVSVRETVRLNCFIDDLFVFVGWTNLSALVVRSMFG